MIKRYNCDIFIVGAGAAGIRAAVQSHDMGLNVLVAVKGGLCRSGSSFYSGTPGWGLCAAMQPGDSPEKHKNEILNLAKGTADEKLAGILVDNVKARIDDLESYGIEFKKNEDGGFLSVKPCFSETERSVSARGMDKIQKVFLDEVKKRSIKVLQNFPVLGLMTEHGVCRGAYGIEGGSLAQVSAKAVVLATGGGISLFDGNYSIGDLTGDGCSMALDAGASLTNLEFIQFIPATQKPKRGRPFEQRALNYLDFDKSRALADEIENISGKKAGEVLKKRSTHGPFSTRDCGKYFDEAIFNDSTSYKTLYFNESLAESGNWVAKNFAQRMSDDGIDLFEGGIGLTLFAQAFNGGILIDENAQTSVKGLFACGEAAGGMHGADRMGGCAMASTQVFGRIAGKNAAEYAKSVMQPDGECDALETLNHKLAKYAPEKHDIKEIKKGVKSAVSGACFCLRDDNKCADSLDMLAKYEKQSLSHAKDAFINKDFGELGSALECYNMINAAQAIVTMIRERKESIGPHYRTDFNKSIDKNSMNILRKIDGKMVVEPYEHKNIWKKI